MRYTTLQLTLAVAALLFIGGCTSVTSLRQPAALTPSPISASPSLGAGDSLGQSCFATPPAQALLDSVANTRTWSASSQTPAVPPADHALAARD